MFFRGAQSPRAQHGASLETRLREPGPDAEALRHSRRPRRRECVGAPAPFLCIGSAGRDLQPALVSWRVSHLRNAVPIY